MRANLSRGTSVNIVIQQGRGASILQKPRWLLDVSPSQLSFEYVQSYHRDDSPPNEAV